VTQEPSHRRHVTLSPVAAAAVAVALLVAGVLVGLYLTRASGAETAAELARVRADFSAVQRAHEHLQGRNAVLFDRLQVAESLLESASATPVPSGPGAGGTYADGTYRVGTDIEDGTYRGTVTGESGYWARLRSTTGTLGSIIANGVPSGDFVLTIYPSDDALELRGVVLTGPE